MSIIVGDGASPAGGVDHLNVAKQNLHNPEAAQAHALIDIAESLRKLAALAQYEDLGYVTDDGLAFAAEQHPQPDTHTPKEATP